GHADLLDLGSDKWIAVFLGTRRNTAVPLTTLGRETFMAPVTWTEDNWPVIGQAGHVELIMDDVVPASQKRRDSIFVDFGKPLSDYPVLKIRVPKDECYIRNAGKSVLTLVGQQELETPLGHPTMLLIRQPEFNCVFTAKLDTDSLEGTAGVCAWLQTNYHARLEIRREKNSVVASMYRHVHDLGAVTAEKTLPDVHGEIELSIIASNDSYEFRADGIPVDRISYASLTTGCTCGNCFTGTMFGIFAQKGKATFLKGMSLRTKETT
ncbi:MAG: hypothetical protein II493_00895, partial [Spirochaetales bacterium]|nr:hypothetical protein [Spirochaetales bacterium]